MSLICIQYYSLYFLLTVIGGNIFINCIIMGLGEVFAGVCSGCLLRNFKDTTVFIGALFLVAIFNVAFYFVPTGLA